jgi:hypothetical protein
MPNLEVELRMEVDRLSRHGPLRGFIIMSRAVASLLVSAGGSLILVLCASLGDLLVAVSPGLCIAAGA